MIGNRIYDGEHWYGDLVRDAAKNALEKIERKKHQSQKQPTKTNQNSSHEA